MKKTLLIFIMLLALCLSACGVPKSEPAETAPPATQPEASTEAPTLSESQPTESAPEPTEPAETAPEALTVLPLPAETVQFSFLSGAGGWRTVMQIKADGSFTGMFSG